MNLPHLQYNFTKQIALVVTKKEKDAPSLNFHYLPFLWNFKETILVNRYTYIDTQFPDVADSRTRFTYTMTSPQLNSISIARRKKEEGNRRKVSFLPGLVFPLCSWSAPRGMFLKLVRIGVMHGAGSF